MTMSLKVQGLREMQAVLNELPKVLAKNTTNRAMMKALEPVARSARAMAPRSPAGGQLVESIDVSPVLNPRQKAEAQLREARGLQLMYVGASSPMGAHAHLVEFGTGPRFQKNGKYVGAMPPRPFLRPAWDANRDEMLASLAASLKEEIFKTVARRARKGA